jgi:hypothetical protein
LKKKRFSFPAAFSVEKEKTRFFYKVKSAGRERGFYFIKKLSKQPAGR